MGKILKIGIVGCGAIGGSLAKALVLQLKNNFKLAALYDIDIKKANVLSKQVSGKKENLVVNSLDELIQNSELIIESASAKFSYGIAQKVLSAGKDIMIMSVGGIVKDFRKLYNLAAKNNQRIYIPSGAICGLDGLKAAAQDSLKEVTLTTIKNPLSFGSIDYIKRRKIKLNQIKKDTVLFSGSAEAAVKYFPQNINVAATLSLVGLGIEKTRVKIIASPFVKKNIHEIRIHSKAGVILARTENILHPENPKTSFLAVLSAISTLKQIQEPVKVGT